MFKVEMKEQRLFNETYESYAELINHFDDIIRYKDRYSIGFINSHNILKISDSQYLLYIIYTEV